MSNKLSDSPVAKESTENEVVPRVLSDKELEKFVGELDPGETGWVPLDEHGMITGPATRDKPEGLSAPVQAPVPAPSDVLTTSSGAPITEAMNPDPTPPAPAGHMTREEQDRREAAAAQEKADKAIKEAEEAKADRKAASKKS